MVTEHTGPAELIQRLWCVYHNVSVRWECFHDVSCFGTDAREPGEGLEIEEAESWQQQLWRKNFECTERRGRSPRFVAFDRQPWRDDL